ncbi:MAG TPA: efflux RND transporter permease subunit [Bryobacteraceae bacterium]|nr:efflux RND transporter permease subunit [Bryobacteraceae bacterium]
MNLSAPFIHRHVATSLLTVSVALVGAIAFRLLPVAPLPEVDFPTVQVSAGLPGASPDTMASSVATPLERQFGRIAGITEMTSSSGLGSTSITLQFDLSRDINAAARDVQAAINAARSNLPADLPSNPRYRKVNPADAPVLILALTSDVKDQAQMYDAASSILAQKLSQVAGVGQVTVGGSSLPAVRVDLDPGVVDRYGLSLSQVATALTNANAHSPTGELTNNRQAWQLRTTDQLLKADQYKSLIVAYRNGAPIRISDLGTTADSVEDLRNAGLSNGKPSVLIIVFRQPGANIIETVDRVYALLPQLRASISPSIHVDVAVDRTTTIRASVRDVERTLLISTGLVILVVFVFLRNVWATVIPSIAVPVSLIGTFAVMYVAGYSLDNLSLMALTISTGFVVDDAIVVIENITRYLEEGMDPFQAALRGSSEIGFTVLSMSISLVAVFIPILLMGGIVGRLFREFAVTLSVAIAVSLVVSLTTTPTMCAHLLRHTPPEKHGWAYRTSEKGFDWILNTYAKALRGVLRHPALTLLVLLITIGVNVYLYARVPKGFFPQQDTGRLTGNILADQSISFQAMKKKVTAFVHVVMSDPAVQNVVAFTGGSSANTGRMFVSLKDLDQRKISADEVIGRIRRKTVGIPGATLFLQAVQDIRVGGRASNAQYQYTLQSQDLTQLNHWAPLLLDKLKTSRQLADLNIDQQIHGLQAYLEVDRDTASRLGLSAQAVDQALAQAFGQAQVSVMYTQLNQYHVVMEVNPEFAQTPDVLKNIYVVPPPPPSSTPTTPTAAPASTTSTTIPPPAAARPIATSPLPPATTLAAALTSASSSGRSPTSTGAGSITISPPSTTINSQVSQPIPLAAFTRFQPTNTPLAVNHQGQFPSITLSFNLPPGVALGQATQLISRAEEELGIPSSVQGEFSGTAQVFQSSLASEPILIATALIAVYIVLGVLYESYVHPLTILSTLPSAGVGALLALLLTGTELSVIALIGIILLIGIVKKNAIMMIDFALDAERRGGKDSRDAIYEACLLRFRPITMTTMAAMLGALPLALGTGTGSELRRPLGITIIGGLIVSQALTLFTTPVVYLFLDRLRLRFQNLRGKAEIGPMPAPVEGTD